MSRGKTRPRHVWRAVGDYKPVRVLPYVFVDIEEVRPKGRASDPGDAVSVSGRVFNNEGASASEGFWGKRPELAGSWFTPDGRSQRLKQSQRLTGRRVRVGADAHTYTRTHMFNERHTLLLPFVGGELMDGLAAAVPVTCLVVLPCQ